MYQYFSFETNALFQISSYFFNNLPIKINSEKKYISRNRIFRIVDYYRSSVATRIDIHRLVKVYTFREDKSVVLFCFLSEKRFALKRSNLLHLIVNSFLV